MPKHNPDDISIGDDQWIRFIDVTGRVESAAARVTGYGIGLKLAALKDFVQTVKADAFVSQRLNTIFDRQVILQLIDHRVRHINIPKG